MNNDWTKLTFVVIPIVCLYLFNGSVNAGNSVAERENGQTVRPLETTVVDAGINRDLDEEDGGAAGESDD